LAFEHALFRTYFSSSPHRDDECKEMTRSLPSETSWIIILGESNIEMRWKMWKLRLTPFFTSPAIPDILHIHYLHKAVPNRSAPATVLLNHVRSTAPSASSFRSRSSYPKQTLYVHSRFLSNVYDSIRRLASLLVTHEG